MRDIGLLSFIVEFVKTDTKFRDSLFKIIIASRNNDKIAIAAANAMTFLNCADTNFSDMDFSGVRIQGANL